MSPCAILANIFLVFHILLLFHSPKNVREISFRISETQKIFLILHSAPCDNKYLFLGSYLIINYIVHGEGQGQLKAPLGFSEITFLF